MVQGVEQIRKSRRGCLFEEEIEKKYAHHTLSFSKMFEMAPIRTPYASVKISQQEMLCPKVDYLQVRTCAVQEVQRFISS